MNAFILKIDGDSIAAIITDDLDAAEEFVESEAFRAELMTLDHKDSRVPLWDGAAEMVLHPADYETVLHMLGWDHIDDDEDRYAILVPCVDPMDEDLAPYIVEIDGDAIAAILADSPGWAEVVAGSADFQKELAALRHLGTDRPLWDGVEPLIVREAEHDENERAMEMAREIDAIIGDHLFLVNVDDRASAIEASAGRA